SGAGFRQRFPEFKWFLVLSRSPALNRKKYPAFLYIMQNIGGKWRNVLNLRGSCATITIMSKCSIAASVRSIQVLWGNSCKALIGGKCKKENKQ
ncbi:MAG: hypothetical protein ACI4J4_07645, partial [Ruminiclostridium sp.]